MSKDRVTGDHSHGYPLQSPTVPSERPAVVVALLGLMALAAFVALVVLTTADEETSVRFRDTGPVESRSMPAELVALRGNRVVVLDSRTGTERRTLARARRADGNSPALQGVAITPDRRSVYYATISDGEGGIIHRVRADGRGSPEVVGRGISPAVSPDGRHLAYATAAPNGLDGSGGGFSGIAVADIAGETRRLWRLPDGDAGAGWLRQASFTKLAWAPDSHRLAFTVSYEGDTVSVLDIAAHRVLSDAVEVVVPGGGGDSRHPTWQASSGQLAVVNQAFECCFDDHYTGPSRTVLVDLTSHVVDELLPPGLQPTWLDFDATGEHLLFVEDGRLHRRSHRGTPVKLASGVVAADW